MQSGDSASEVRAAWQALLRALRGERERFLKRLEDPAAAQREQLAGILHREAVG